MTRLAHGGQALRAVALLPGVTGAYGRCGGGALLVTAASFELNYNAMRKPSGPGRDTHVNHLALGEALLEMNDPPIRALFIAANNPAVTYPDAGKTRRGLAREDLFTVVHDPSCRSPRAMPTSCCRRRPTWRPRTSTAPTAPTTCSTATVR